MKRVISTVAGLWLITMAFLPIPAFSQTDYKLEKVSLQLPWKHQFEFAGFYAAMDKGYYRESGLDVEIREYEKDIDKIGLVLSGKATFSIDYSTVIRARMEGKPITLLANYFKRSPVALATKPDIYFPGDLKGKKVMGDKRDLDSPIFAMMFGQFNMSSDDFTLVPHTYNIDKFINNEVDAMTVFLTNELYDLRQAKVPYNVIDPNNYGVPLYDVNMFTSESFARNKPSVVRSFVDASNRGWVYALAHPEETVDLIIEKYNTQNKSKEHLLFEAEQTRRMMQPDIYPIGSIDPNRIRRIEEQFVSEGVATNIVEPEEFIFGVKEMSSISQTLPELENPVTLNEDEKAFLASHPVIRAQNTQDWAPFDFYQDGQPQGYTIDMMNLLAKRLNVRFKYVSGPTWGEFTEMLKKREIDVIGSMVRTDERKAFALFTEQPMIRVTSYIASRSDSPYHSIQQLTGKTIAVVEGFFHEKAMRENYPEVKLQTYKNTLKCLEAVAYGDADATIGVGAVMQHLWLENSIGNLSLTGQVNLPGSEGYSDHIAVRKDWPLLASALDKAMATVTYHEKQQLKQKWFGGVPAAISLTSEEEAFIRGHPVITASNEQKWAPFNFFEDGQPKGFSIDYLNLLAEKVGLKVDYVSGPSWKEFVELTKNKEIDVLLNTAYSEERNAWFEFLEHPYIGVSYGLVVNTARSDIHGFKDILDKTIAVEDGFWMQRWFAENHPGTRLVPYKNTLEALTAVSVNEADVYVGNVSVGGYLLNKHWLTNLRVVPLGDTTLKKGNDLYIALPRDMTVLKSILDKAMAAVTDEEVNRLAAKWVLQNMGSRPQAAEAAGISLSKKEQAYLRKTDEIAYCVDPDWMPFERINDKGRHEGMTADLMNAVERRLGVRLRLVPTDSWSESLLSVREGRCQFVSAAAETAPRKEYLEFSKPYGEYSLVVAVGDEEVFVENLAAIRDKTLGVIKGYAAVDLIRERYPNFKIVEVGNVADGLQKVQDEEIYGFVDTVPTINYTLRRKGIEHLKIGGKLDIPLKLAFGIHKGEPPELLGLLNKVLASFSEEETQLLAEKWFSIKVEKVFDYARLWQVLAVVALIFLVILYWNRRLSVMARKLKFAKDEAEAANRAKSAFFANMSHELRTPLNAILGFTQLLAREKDLGDKQAEKVETIGRSGEHLLALINDGLELSKIEAGKMELHIESFDLHRFILGLEEMFRLRAQEKGLYLKFELSEEVPQFVRADQNKLRQVLINLLGNAVKFTDKGGIALHVRRKNNMDDSSMRMCILQFEVIDTGIGIAEQDQQYIFDAFYQTRDQKASLKGTGLGLTISQNFIQLMGGTLKVKSALNQGASFTFDLPLQFAGSTPETTHSLRREVIGLADGQPEFKILVAEDNSDNSIFLITLLLSVGFDVREAVNGEEAVEFWQKWHPHLILMDIQMPEMSGVEAIREIRRQPGGEDVKIIALTAHAFVEDREQILESGGDDYLRKPFTEDAIFQLINKHLGVQYEFDDDDDESKTSTFDTSDIPALLETIPETMRSALQHEILIGDVKKLNNLIAEIGSVNPELGKFFQTLADDFAYDEIAAYLGPVNTNVEIKKTDDDERVL